MKRPGESRHEFFVRRIGEMGVGQADADYGGKLAEWVLELSRTMRDQGHSGQSFALTLALFDNLLQEWESSDYDLSPAAKFDQAAQAIADTAAVPVPHVAPRAKLFLSKEDPRLIQRAVCSKCGAGIYWLTSKKTGKKMPFDSLVQMIDEAGDLGVDLAKNHWATCPNADDFRKKG